ncbi:MAG: ABC transporter permease [Desulfamplus sp.]|nr:ABC transporter permease [Desulfamplus sp.]
MLILKLTSIFKISFRSLMLHKLRSALSILGIICGTMAVIVMISIGEGARQKIVGQIEQLGIKNIYINTINLTEEQRLKARQNLSSGLNTDDAERIKTGCRYIMDTACLKEVSASLVGVRLRTSPQIVATSSSYASLLNLSLMQGRFISKHDVESQNMVCVLGDTVAKNLGDGGKIGRSVRIENNLFKIIGILNRYNHDTEKNSAISVRDYNEIIFIPLNAFGNKNNILVNRSNNVFANTINITEIIVQTNNSEEVIIAGRMIKRIMEVAHNQINDYQIIIPMELLKQTQKIQRTFTLVLSAIASISLFVGGIGIMNIMLAIVYERTREIGIRRAVGATQNDIIFQFLTESIILTSIGGSAGILTGAIAAKLLSLIAGWETIVTLFSVFLPFVMSVLIGVFFGLYPAYQAAKMDPVSALRHE